MAIPVCIAQLIGTFLETLGYGIYIVILPKCLEILHKGNLRRGLMYYLLTTTVISFILITMHLIASLIRAFGAFTSNMDIPGFPQKYYANHTALSVMKTASYVSVSLVADTLLVYRTFIIWGRNIWISIVPVILLVLVAAISVWFTLSHNQGLAGREVLTSTTVDHSKYFYAATLTLNIICTSLITFRIWNIQRRVIYLVGPGRYTILTVILESAAVYTAILCCLIGTTVAGNSTMFFFLNPMPPVIGSVFSYVIVRSSMDNKHFDTSSTGYATDHENGNTSLVLTTICPISREGSLPT